MKMPRLPLIYALTAVAVAATLAGCDRQAPVSAIDEPTGPRPAYESWSVRFDITDAGLPRTRLDAPYLARFETPDSTFTLMRRDGDEPVVTAELFDEAGKHSATVTAHEIRYYDDLGRFDASGEVVVAARGERTLFTEALQWFESERKLRTPAFVRIVTPDERIQGYHLVADEDLNNYTLARVTGQVTVEDP
jgi:LPS export ABC transporter protein LptC